MQSSLWKKAALALLAVAVIAVAIFYFTTRSSRSSAITSVNPAFAEYISSYTAGVISSGSALKIVLANDAVDSASVGQESSVKLFSFSPGISGKTVWLDRRTVEFTPSSRLEPGRLYNVAFMLSKLVDVQDDLEEFDFSVQVIPQNFEASIRNIKPYVNTDFKREKVEGIILTADFADNAAVENTVTAEQLGKKLKINWAHTGEGKQHEFTIEEVARGNDESAVDVKIEGEGVSVKRTDKIAVPVPSIKDFKVTDVRVDQGTSQHVVIQFSDPIAERQNLDGLVSIGDVGTVDYEIKDNEIRIYPSVRQTGPKTVTVARGIANTLQQKLSKDEEFQISFEQLNPAVRFTGKGTILPGTDGMIMPFEAVNLKSVDVQVVRIFEKNIPQFLQVNEFDGQQELRRVGQRIIKKTISLENAGITDLGKWNRYSLDLTKLMSSEPGAIYQVKIGFKRSYLAYECTEGDTGSDVEAIAEQDWDDQGGDDSNWDYYDEYYYSEDYDWEERDNPCHSSYYTGSRNVQKNILASDLGLLAKRGGDGKTYVFANDVRTTKPASGVTVELFDFQQQLIGSATTDGDGKAIITGKGFPFLVIGKNGSQRGYLKVSDGASLSISNFDVSGEHIEKGLKGFLYGERGVWRPGDSLYLTFILEDKLKQLPPTHPVVFELQNPQGQVTSRIVRSKGENGFYRFATATSPDDQTGAWRARVKVGGTEFNQPIRIETVKPNRLKINLDFGVEKLTAANSNITGNLQVDWLHGAPGSNLAVNFEVVLTKGETKFPRYPDFAFDDPSRGFTSENQMIFEGYTDDRGHATVNARLETTEPPPGMLNAVFRGKAYEESGNFSIDRFTIPYYPFKSFTGIRLPPGDKARGMLLTDTTHRVDVVTLDPDGNPMSRDNIEMSIYKLQWRWWWNSDGNDANYMSTDYAEPIAKGTTKTVNGKGAWNFRIKYPEWGRYLVKAYDPVSGHTTGKVVYIDWPGWAGRSRGGNEGATMLSFTSDKPNYTIGDKVKLAIPGSDNGRALISIENGSGVIQASWLETKKGDNAYTFEVTRAMSPNVYAHVTLLQPHAQTTNDLPIRLYGVIPIKVEDPATHLEPVISMPDVLEPGQEVSIKVSEKTNKKMTYTVAVVDEGLLDLTKFKTPDAWNRFYAREALGVKTWDLYDDVIGAYGAQIERLLAIGGDGEASSKEDDPRANRFVPVVKFFGPYTMSGGTRDHKFVMPQYIGSVKTMIVAGMEGAYGKTDKATPVRKPLMVLATLPRVLGPEETVKLPVTLFTMDKSIREVQVVVKTTGPLGVGQSTQTATITGSDKTVFFDLSVSSAIGVGTVEVTATSGKFSATDKVEIDVRNANPPVSRVEGVVLEAGKDWTHVVVPAGMPGTNSGVLEVSTLPPINLGQRMKYLLQYPYGCIEQTTSTAFPQLYLDKVKQLTDGEKSAIQKNIKAAIERLKLFAATDGGFTYWPGGVDSDSWASTYAAHFLLEAQAQGYVVPSDLLKKWRKYERNKIQSFRNNSDQRSNDLIQSYRLYTMALAGDAELGAMNRLREMNGRSLAASWMLAAAYAKAGQPEAAKAIIANQSTDVKPYQEMAYSYGSDLRDKAIMLETLMLLKEREKGFELLKDISTSLSSDSYWMSTQTVAWCLKSVASFAGQEKRGDLTFTYDYNGKSVEAKTDLPVAQVNLAVDGTKNRSLHLSNRSKGVLFVRVITNGTPARGQEDDGENNLRMTVSYTDYDGNPIDPTELEQGQEFTASVSVMNPGTRGSFKNLAIHQIFPSGWEINNLRLEAPAEAEGDEEAAGVKDDRLGDTPTYQDIRDDRVYTYFDLSAGQRKTFKVLLTAGFTGSYYLPAVNCEAMYDHSVYARKKGQPVTVARKITQ